jgi:hypothetical protein
MSMSLVCKLNYVITSPLTVPSTSFQPHYSALTNSIRSICVPRRIDTPAHTNLYIFLQKIEFGINQTQPGLLSAYTANIFAHIFRIQSLVMYFEAKARKFSRLNSYFQLIRFPAIVNTMI